MSPLPASPRRFILLGPSLLVMGLAWSLSSPSSLPGFVATTGFTLTLLGLHQLGRSGAIRRSGATRGGSAPEAPQVP